VIERWDTLADEDMDLAVAAAREAFDHGPWPNLPPAERAAQEAVEREGENAS